MSNETPPLDLSRRVILVVEDNPDDLELIRAAFARNELPCELVSARDGVEALAYLESGEPPPRLVLLDLRMPRIDGLEVLRRIRANANTRLQPVVILTSSREQEDVLDGYRLGANSYVRKPINFGQLVEAARQLGQYWLRINEAPPPAMVVSR
jgi:two-component system response regulator